MRFVSLATMITRVRLRTGTENSQHVTDAELTEMITEAFAELYEKMCLAGNGDYVDKIAVLATTPGLSFVTLPTDFFMVKSVTAVSASGSYTEMRRADLRDLGVYLQPGSASLDYAYSLSGLQTAPSSTMSIWPTPRADLLGIDVCYMPVVAPSTSTVGWDGVNGWEDLVLWTCASQVFLKRSDAESFAMAQQMKAAASARIDAIVKARDAANPAKIRRVRDTRRFPRRWAF